MPKLSNPSRHTLSEAIALLMERGYSEADAKSTLLRAFADGDIPTRGRCDKFEIDPVSGMIDYSRPISETDEITKRSIAPYYWESAIVVWENNCFLLTGELAEFSVHSIDMLRKDLFRSTGLTDERADMEAGLRETTPDPMSDELEELEEKGPVFSTPIYRSPFMEFMDQMIIELGITKDNQLEAETIHAHIRKKWPKHLGEISDHKVNLMTTFMREPESQKGGNRKFKKT